MSRARRARVVTEPEGLRVRHAALLAPDRRQRAFNVAMAAALIGLLAFALIRLEFSLGAILGGFDRLATLLVLMVPPAPDSWARAALYLHALAETVAIAFLGTLLGAVLAFPLALLAARNATIGRVVQFVARRASDSIRSIDQLVWALIWVNVVGLGPFAGMLAVMTGEIGNFSKLFSEAIEAADAKPVEGVIAAGGSRLQGVRFGILPQVLPVIASQVLYFFESNTRSSTIIGIVGAGGIGLHLAEQIRTLEWPSVAFIILLILGAVMVIDTLSARLRLAIIGRAAVTDLGR